MIRDRSNPYPVTYYEIDDCGNVAEVVRYERDFALSPASLIVKDRNGVFIERRVFKHACDAWAYVRENYPSMWIARHSDVEDVFPVVPFTDGDSDQMELMF